MAGNSWAKDYADAIILELKEFFSEATGIVLDVDDSILWAVGLIILFLIYQCNCCGGGSSSSKKKEKEKNKEKKDEDKKTEGTDKTDKDGKKAPRIVYKKKSISIAYFLLTFGGFQGAHHFYLGDVVMGTAYIFTFGFFGLGYLWDQLSLWYRIMKKNKRATKDAEIGFKRLCVKTFCQLIPAVLGAAWVIVVVIGLGAPFILHYTGMVDLYKRRGNLQMSAYELLDVGRMWSHEDLKKNFKRQSLKYHPDRNSDCGEMYKSCTQRMQELNVAHDLLLGGIIDLEAIIDDWYSVDDCAKEWIPYYGKARDDIDAVGFQKWTENMSEQVMATLGIEDPAEARARKKAEKKRQREAEKAKREEEKRRREEEKRKKEQAAQAARQETQDTQSEQGQEEDIDEMDTNVLIDMLGPDYDLELLKKLFEEGAARREARLKSEEDAKNGGGEANGNTEQEVAEPKKEEVTEPKKETESQKTEL